MTARELAKDPHILPAEDGLYTNVLDLHYHQWDAISQTALKTFEIAPAKYKEEKDNPPEITPQKQQNFDFGSAIHMAVLQPDELDKWFRPRPEGHPNSNAYKDRVAAMLADNPFLRILKGDNYDALPRIRDAVWSNPDAAALLEGAEVEQSGVATDPTYGFRAKFRLDIRNPSLGVLADLKSTTDARPEHFGRQMEDLRYYRQAAFYIRYSALLGLPERDFAVIAIEKDPPYLTWVHQVPDKWLVAGEEEMDLLLERYAECERLDVWPGYPGGLHELQPTDWQMKSLELRIEALRGLGVAA